MVRSQVLCQASRPSGLSGWRERYLVDVRRVDKCKSASGLGIFDALQHSSEAGSGEGRQGKPRQHGVNRRIAIARREHQGRHVAARDPLRRRLGTAFGLVRGHEPDHEVDDGPRVERHACRPEPPDLDKAGYGVRGGADQRPAMRRQQQLVVADEPPEAAEAVHAGNQRQRQSGLSRAGRAGDQNATVAEQHGAGMDVRRHAQLSAGRVTVKRAPRMSPGLAPGMFSAVSVPPCASTIWREIDRPRPEFWPKASPAGRSV